MQAGTYIDPVTSRLPHGTRAQVIDGWKTASPLRKIERKGEPNLIDRSKKTTKNLTPIGRVDSNGFAALLGTDLDEEDLADVGSGNAFDDEEDLASTPFAAEVLSLRTARDIKRVVFDSLREQGLIELLEMYQ